MSQDFTCGECRRTFYDDREYKRHLPKCAEKSQGTGQAGLKDDSDKLRYDLLPWGALEGLARVLTFGAKKYAPNGWKSVPNGKERYEAAMLRHLAALKRGEVIDLDSGLPHIDHLVCNAVFLSELSLLRG